MPTISTFYGLLIQMFFRDHAPPHFHVKSANIDAAFSIRDCSLLKGNIDGKTQRLIEYWHNLSRDKLTVFWNQTRPTNCPVGKIKDEI